MAYEQFRLRKRVNKVHFSSLPQPSKVPPVPVTVDDEYLKGLERFIDNISNHLLEIQEDEIKLTDQFSRELKDIQDNTERTAEEKIELGNQAKKKFVRDITTIRDRRKQYREILYDAMQDRQGLWDSAKMQKEDEVIVQRKLQDLAILPMEDAPKVQLGRSSQDFAVGVYAIFQIIFIIGYALLTEFEEKPSPLRLVGTPLRVSNYFTFLIFILLMVFVGMTFLQAYMKKFGFGATLGQFLVAVFAFQWSIFVFGFFAEAARVNGYTRDTTPGVELKWEKVKLGTDSLLYGAYGAGATLIAIASTLGKVKPTEHFIVAFLFVPAMGANFFLGYWVLHAVDTGFSIFIFTFAGFWAIAYALARVPKPEPINKETALTKDDHLPILPKDMENNDSSYNSDLFSTLGAIVMFCTFPAWNAAFAPDGTQYRVVANTVFSQLGATIFAFLFSRTFRGGKFRIGDIRVGIIAGGVAVSSITSWLVAPGGALVTGAVVGSMAVLLYTNIGARAYRAVAYDDSVGVHAIYAYPGLIGALAGIISAAVHVKEDRLIYGQTLDELVPWRGRHQAGWNAIVLCISLAFAVILGGLLGMVFRFVPDEVEYYTDDLQWIVPPDFDREPKPTSVVKKPKPRDSTTAPPPSST